MIITKYRLKLIVLAIFLLLLIAVTGTLTPRKPSYRQLAGLKADMTLEEVIYELGSSYEDIGSGTIVLRYWLRDRNAAAILTFYQDKLANILVKYATGELEHLL